MTDDRRSILVVGSVALDSIETPSGKVEEVLGGSAVYFSLSASFFTAVNLVAVVGADFPEEHLALLRTRPINIKGLQKIPGKTFRWKGKYTESLNEAITLDTQLNVFSEFHPQIPDEYKNCKYVFLANIDPDLQLEVLAQIKKPVLIATDTMNYWIEKKPAALKKLFSKIDILIINEEECKEFTNERNLLSASDQIRSPGLKALIIKRGKYGALLFTNKDIFSAPGYLLAREADPTGAGDSFAGGFMGYLARHQTENLSEENFRKAVIFGSVLASFNVEDFGPRRLTTLTYPEIKKRFEEFKKLTYF